MMFRLVMRMCTIPPYFSRVRWHEVIAGEAQKGFLLVTKVGRVPSCAQFSGLRYNYLCSILGNPHKLPWRMGCHFYHIR